MSRESDQPSDQARTVEEFLAESLPKNKLFPVTVSVRDLMDFMIYMSGIRQAGNFIRAVQQGKPLGPAEFFVSLVVAESDMDVKELFPTDTESPELLDREDRAVLLSRRMSGAMEPIVKPVIQNRILEFTATKMPDLDPEVVRTGMEEFSESRDFYSTGFMLMSREDYEQPVTFHLNFPELELLNEMLIPHVEENGVRQPEKVAQLTRLNQGFVEAGGPTSPAFINFLGHA